MRQARAYAMRAQAAWDFSRTAPGCWCVSAAREKRKRTRFDILIFLCYKAVSRIGRKTAAGFHWQRFL